MITSYDANNLVRLLINITLHIVYFKVLKVFPVHTPIAQIQIFESKAMILEPKKATSN